MRTKSLSKWYSARVKNGFVDNFLNVTSQIIELLNRQQIERVVETLCTVKNNQGRIFFAGSGGGAGHSSHASADFRKLVAIESYSISDNVSELTARINDDSWSTCYRDYLASSRISQKDCLFVISVGGGDSKLGISENIVHAIDYAIEMGSTVVGIVGRDGGHVAQRTQDYILIPTVEADLVTFQVEGLQSLIWHLIVGHPKLLSNTPKWESESKG